MDHTPTIHNEARYGEIAETVLMPGDPVRAEYIARTYCPDSRLVSNLRRICAYTGTYKGKEVTVMASGMGAGSMGIYSYELFGFYGVEKIVRVGSAGGLSPKLKLGDMVAGVASCTDSGFAGQFRLPGTLAPAADYGLLEGAMAYAREQGIPACAGTLFSGEAFHYGQDVFERWRDMGVLAVEMESAALYMNAAYHGKKALALCTISDLMFTGEAMGAGERETSFNQMIETALSLI